MKKENEEWYRSNLFKLGSLIFILIIAFVLLVPLLSFWLSKYLGGGITQSGQLGDTIGGTMGPFIAIIASFLTFIAFYVQYQANEQQKKDLQIERFESKFYTMLEIHRQNVNGLKINDKSKGISGFSDLYVELSSLYFIIKSEINGKYSEELTFNITYLFFFFGTGVDPMVMIKSFFKPENHKFLEHLRDLVEKKIKYKKEDKTYQYNYIDESNENTLVMFKFKPFYGHSGNLSHYIRHLYQLIALIHNQPETIFNYEDKYSYAAIVRAQLSIHEQLLLYYNSLSVLGNPWIENDFIREYCLVKSMPTALAYFYMNPIEFLGSKNKHGKIMFEWQSIIDRIDKITTR